MRKTLALMAAVAAAWMAAPSSADAGPAVNRRSAVSAMDMRGATYSEGGIHRAPGGFLSLCDSRPELCGEMRTRPEVSAVLARLGRSGDFERVALTAERRRELSDVNAVVNGMIAPRTERGDVWSLATRAGDCEDYALTKREALVALGWPRASLRIAVGETARGVPHAVLLARTNAGDLVLDNLTDRIETIGQSGHALWAVESSLRPGTWAYIAGAERRSTPVAVRRAEAPRFVTGSFRR